ncbi:DUF6541 family protein [Leucobacter sp. NPDC058333]|uniref:DUF6541 family protein n=1 Tax=Leucobacter sp. NPDC058333 TaxID=3346450 RepID=UPI003664303C
MTSWFAITPVFLAAAAVLLLPGLLIGVALRLRGLWLWATAGPISVSVIALSALGLSFAGIGWGVWPVLAVSVVLAVLIGLLVRFVFRQPVMRVADGAPAYAPLGLSTGAKVSLVATLVLVGIIMAWRVTHAIGSPDDISQTFDNIFHLNAVQFVLDQQDASPLKIGLMNSPMGNLGFYPSGWHAVVSLVVDLSGASIPVATNAVTLVVAAIIWGSGGVLLARTLLGRGAAVALSAAVLSAAFPVFPILMLGYGVLYPMFLGFALVPAALAVVVGIIGFEKIPTTMKLSTRWLLLLGLTPGLAVTHPGALMALLACSVPFVLVWAFNAVRDRRREGRSIAFPLISLVLYLVGGFALFLAVRPPRAQAFWQAEMGAPEATLRFFTSQLDRGAIPYVTGALVLIGVVVALIRRDRVSIAMLGTYAMVGIMFIVVAGVHHWGTRFWVTGIWYQNIPRIEAITVFATLPLAVLGLSTIIVWIARLAGDRRVLAGGLTLLLVAAVLVLTQASTAMQKITEKTRDSFAYGKDSDLVNTDELALLKRLADEVPEGATIAGNGWTGAGMAYAFSGRWVTMPHVMIDFTEDTLLVNEELRDAQPGSKVCDAIAAENIEYVLDFGDREVHKGNHDMPGLDDLDKSSAVKLVDSEGDARLYRVVGCE